MASIKTISIFKIDYMQSKAEHDFTDVKPIINSFSEYDIKGNLIKEISYYTNGEVEHISQYKYNDAGLLEEEILINEEGSVDERKKFEYNANNKVEKEYLFYQDDSFDTTIHTYDGSFNLIKKSTKDSDGEMESEKEYIYENNLLISETYTDNEKNVISKKNYSYNDQGKQLTVKEYDGVNDVEINIEFVYNENGVRTDKITTNKKGQVMEHVFYEENEKGQLIEMVDHTPFAKNITVFTYDEKGNNILQEEKNNQGELNNRILRTFDIDNKIMEVAVTIDYHGLRLNQNYLLQHKYEYFED